jgi:hypothetical protein
LLGIHILFFITSVAYAQDAASPIPQVDDAAKKIAEDIHKKLVENNVQSVALGQFTYQRTMPPLGTHWRTRLAEELSNMPEKPYEIVSGELSDAEWAAWGEIVEAANIIRVHTRLIRTEGQSIEAIFRSDIERTAALTAMIVPSGSGDGGSASVPPDEYEDDTWDNPVPVEIVAGENARPINRSIHSGDEDFFLLIPEKDCLLTAETTGSTDTVMYLFNYDTHEQLATNDDGGQGTNARIRHNVIAGTRYLAMVRGYNRSSIGNYGFRAFTSGGELLASDDYEPNDDFSRATAIEIGSPQEHTFHSPDDVDWVQFRVTRPGIYTIRARGARTNRLDTYIELFDANLNPIADDDDGGDNVDAMLSLHLGNGLYYLKVWCLDASPDQLYIISITNEE